MAAQAFKLYNRAIYKLGAGTINLPGAVRAYLVQSTSNFATGTLSLLGSVSNQVASGNGYLQTGFQLVGEVWTAGQSAGQMKFDASNPSWIASGGNIANIKAVVLAMSGGSAGARHVLAYASLTSTQFTLSSGNTLTLQLNTLGVFTAANA